MYRAGVKPWHSVGWKPSTKQLTHSHHAEPTIGSSGSSDEKPGVVQSENGKSVTLSGELGLEIFTYGFLCLLAP